MPNEKVFDREEIKSLFDKGHSMQEIARMKGCSLSTVRRIIETGGVTKVNHSGDCKKLEYRSPILVEEISRYRERLKIGQKVRFEVPEHGLFKTEQKVKELTVVSKSTWFFTARDEKGRTYTKMYVEMVSMEREQHGAAGSNGFFIFRR